LLASSLLEGVQEAAVFLGGCGLRRRLAGPALSGPLLSSPPSAIGDKKGGSDDDIEVVVVGRAVVKPSLRNGLELG
jgi:hypothetical protein